MESTTYDPRIDTGAPRVDTTIETRHTAYTRPRETRTVGTLFAELWRETTTLVHEEAELAKAYAAGYVGRNIMGSGFECDIVIHRGAGEPEPRFHDELIHGWMPPE